MLQKLQKTDYVISAWSGGTTTQLAICPPGAVYAERDFLWRVSSAAVELEESVFTPLPDYERLIATLEGEIVLTHNGGAPLRLRPFEVHAFSGADATHSRGRCRDFNLMLRRGKAAGSMEALELPAEPRTLPSPASGETVLLYCVCGACKIDTGTNRIAGVNENAGTGIACPSSLRSETTLFPGEALLLSDPAALTLSGPARLMLCRMRVKTVES